MRRELTIRCVSTGSIRTDNPDGARVTVREFWLDLDGLPARVQLTESTDRGQRSRDCTVDFDGISVRIRAGCDIAPLTAVTRAPLDWLIAIAVSMKEGERHTVALWVRSMDPAALLHATPVTSVRHRRRDEVLDDATARESLLAPPPLLRVVGATA